MEESMTTKSHKAFWVVITKSPEGQPTAFKLEPNSSATCESVMFFHCGDCVKAHGNEALLNLWTRLEVGVPQKLRELEVRVCSSEDEAEGKLAACSVVVAVLESPIQIEVVRIGEGSNFHAGSGVCLSYHDPGFSGYLQAEIQDQNSRRLLFDRREELVSGVVVTVHRRLEAAVRSLEERGLPFRIDPRTDL
jgi:hypothetical protein